MNFPLALTSVIVLVAINTVNCLRAIEEPPFNCQASKAASSPSYGMEMCTNLKDYETRDDLEAQDVVFECACALSTHTYWYKGIMSYTMKQMIEAMDGAIEVPVNRTIGAPILKPRGLYYGSLYHQTKYMKKQNDENLWKNENYQSIENVQATIQFNIVTKFVDIYYDIETGRDLELARHRGTFLDHQKVIVDSCQELLADERLTGFIEPSLEAIGRAKVAGKNTQRALIMSQAELSTLLSASNICDWFIGRYKKQNESQI